MCLSYNTMIYKRFVCILDGSGCLEIIEGRIQSFGKKSLGGGRNFSQSYDEAAVFVGF